MNIDIKSSGLELTEALKQYINTRMNSLERQLHRYDPAGLRIEFEVARTTKHHLHGDVFYAEANLELPGKMLRATHEASDIRVAVDKIKDILQREIERHKEQQEEH
ncbi:MAG: ribosome-associated translation inhibitor RaiA [Candidatus Colwellbacteria bacterium]|nr:ribosome-associated translation inhibitor RaiA [Candidatus Colwellbacteria bacterium]